MSYQSPPLQPQTGKVVIRKLGTPMRLVLESGFPSNNYNLSLASQVPHTEAAHLDFRIGHHSRIDKNRNLI